MLDVLVEQQQSSKDRSTLLFELLGISILVNQASRFDEPPQMRVLSKPSFRCFGATPDHVADCDSRIWTRLISLIPPPRSATRSAAKSEAKTGHIK